MLLHRRACVGAQNVCSRRFKNFTTKYALSHVAYSLRSDHCSPFTSRKNFTCSTYIANSPRLRLQTSSPLDLNRPTPLYCAVSCPIIPLPTSSPLALTRTHPSLPSLPLYLPLSLFTPVSSASSFARSFGLLLPLLSTILARSLPSATASRRGVDEEGVRDRMTVRGGEREKRLRS